MAINHESLMEQLTNVVNQLGHIRKQLQQEVQRANTPADQTAVLREENAQLRSEIEARQRESAMAPINHYDTTAATEAARTEAAANEQRQDEIEQRATKQEIDAHMTTNPQTAPKATQQQVTPQKK